MTTTDVEHGFVSAQIQTLEEAIARAKFTEAAAGEQESRKDQTKNAETFESHKPG